MSSGNIYTFNEGSRKINRIKEGDIIYDGINNKFITINNVFRNYNYVLELCVYKTRPIKLTGLNKVLTIQHNNDKPIWKNVNELTVIDYVAITTKHLSTIKYDNIDKYLLMGIYITCGKIKNNKLLLYLNNYNTLYQFIQSSTVYNHDTDYELVIDIIDKLFNIKYCKRFDSYKKQNVILTFELTKELNNFIDNIDNEILNIDNYYNLHELVKGMHFSKINLKNKLYIKCKNTEDANKYYSILRHYGMDIKIKKSLLNFNSIYKINMNNSNQYILDNPSPNVISCFYNNPHEYYSIDYTFLKVMSVVDTLEYENVVSFDINNKCYNVENILIM